MGQEFVDLWSKHLRLEFLLLRQRKSKQEFDDFQLMQARRCKLESVCETSSKKSGEVLEATSS